MLLFIITVVSVSILMDCGEFLIPVKKVQVIRKNRNSFTHLLYSCFSQLQVRCVPGGRCLYYFALHRLEHLFSKSEAFF